MTKQVTIRNTRGSRTARALLAVLLMLTATAGLGGCFGGSLSGGEKAQVERYLEQRYGGDFEVIIPRSAAPGTENGIVLYFPAHAYNTTSPEIVCGISRAEGGGYTDDYPAAVLEWQLKKVVDTALSDAGLEAVCNMYCSMSDETRKALGDEYGHEILTNLTLSDYLARSTTEELDIMADIAVYGTIPTIDDLAKKLTQAFGTLDVQFQEKERLSFGLVFVETSDPAAFREEVALNGIDAYPQFEQATIVSPKLSLVKSGSSYTHEGFRLPLKESLQMLYESE